MVAGLRFDTSMRDADAPGPAQRPALEQDAAQVGRVRGAPPARLLTALRPRYARLTRESITRAPDRWQSPPSPYTEKTDEQKAITEMVRQFVDNEVIPIAEEHDHEDKFPEAVVEQMKELGLFGVTIPEEYGGMGLDLTTYAMIVEELSRGWISVSGIVNTHFIGSYLLMKFGTDEQKQRRSCRAWPPARSAPPSRCPSPRCGSDVQGIKSDRQEARRRRLGAQRPEDVGDQRAAVRRSCSC